MKISIVIPVFNEANNLIILNRKIHETLLPLGIEYGVVYVDDGSSDGSSLVLQQIYQESDKVKVITLARNFGQTQALAAGIDNSDSEVIITMDADLQNDPEDIPALLAKINEGFDVVSGWRVERHDHLFFKKIPSYIANKLSVMITKVELHDLGCTLKAYKRSVLEGIEFYGEIHRFLPVCAAMQGAKIAEIPVKHHPRIYGNSKYGVSRIFKVVLDMGTIIFVWKFFARPVYVFGGIGMLFLGLAAFNALFIILRKLFFGGVWVSPLLFLFVILSTMGIQFLLMGILAELVIRLYYGAKHQKRYVIKGILLSKDK